MIKQETDALRAVRVETDKLSDLAKSFYAAVTKVKQRPNEVRKVAVGTLPTGLLKPVGT